MLIKAEQKFVRLSPRKLRLVADGIRSLPIITAFEQLQALNKTSALPLKKTLRQAQANAINNLKLDPATLSIKAIQINAGPTYKRWQPVSRGRAHSIFKHTSHIRVILESPDAKPATDILTPKATKPSRDTIKPSSKTVKTTKSKTTISKSAKQTKK